LVTLENTARTLASSQNKIKTVGNFFDAIFYGYACHKGLHYAEVFAKGISLKG
jgi:hypothetical protein